MLIAKKATSGVDPNLLSRWLFNEGTGTTAVDSVSARNLTLNNGATWGTGSMLLDGTDDYASRGSVDFGLNGGTECSVSFYIKTSATTGRIVQKQLISDGYNTIMFRMGGSGLVVCSVNNETLDQYPEWTNTVPFDSNFHLVTFTYKKNAIDSTDGIIYIDRSVATNSYSANNYASNFVIQETSNNLMVGVRPVSLTQYLAGEIKDLRVYNKMLSAGEVTALP